jgi:hypothetical protein
MTGESVSAPPAAYHWNYFEFGYGKSPYVTPPTVSITIPTELESFYPGEDQTYSATGFDRVDGNLPESAFHWTYDGVPIPGTFSTVYKRDTVDGVHTMTVTAYNADGASASDTVHIRIKSPPQPGHPIVRITTPADGSSYCTTAFDGGGDYIVLQTAATATDPSVPPGPLTYEWSDSIGGGARQTVATTLTPQLKLYLREGELTTTHDLRLTATNSTGSTSDDVRVYIRDPFQCIG